jgi:hypothetical protein
MSGDDFDSRMEEARRESARQRALDEAKEEEDAKRKRDLSQIMDRSPRGYGGGGGGLISKVFGWTVFIVVVLFVIFLIALWIFPHGNQ